MLDDDLAGFKSVNRDTAALPGGRQLADCRLDNKEALLSGWTKKENYIVD